MQQYTEIGTTGDTDAARDIMTDGIGLPFDEAIITLKTLFKYLNYVSCLQILEMPSCCVPLCRNNDRMKTKSLTFHRFIQIHLFVSEENVCTKIYKCLKGEF